MIKGTCLTLSSGMDQSKKEDKIRNRNDQVPHLTQDTNGKVTSSQLDITNTYGKVTRTEKHIKQESQEVSPFPAADHKIL